MKKNEEITIKDLIKELQKYPPDTPIFIGYEGIIKDAIGVMFYKKDKSLDKDVIVIFDES